MINLSFALGMLTMLAIILIIVIVVGFVKVIKLKKDVDVLSSDLFDYKNYVEEKFAEAGRLRNDIMNNIYRDMEENLKIANAYTDKRIDKNK